MAQLGDDLRGYQHYVAIERVALHRIITDPEVAKLQPIWGTDEAAVGPDACRVAQLTNDDRGLDHPTAEEGENGVVV
jgi:hypothetical protein